MAEETTELNTEDQERRANSRREEAKDVARMLRLAHEQSESRIRNTEPDPLIALIGFLDKKPLSEWGVPEYKKAFAMFTNVEGTDEEKSVASDVKDHLQARVRDLRFSDEEKSELFNSTVSPHDLSQFNLVAEEHVSDMSDKEILIKKNALDLQIAKADPSQNRLFDALKGAIDDQVFVRNVYRMNQLEVQMANPNLFPPTGDTAIDTYFPTAVERIKELSRKNDYENLNVLYEDLNKQLLVKGSHEHRLFLDVVKGRINQLERTAANLKQQGEVQDAQMEVFSTSRQSFREEDRPLYEGSIDETIKERFNRIMDASSDISDAEREEIDRYYNNIRRWVGVVMQNSVNNPDRKGGGLHLHPDREKRFKEIIDPSHDPRAMSLEVLKENIKYLRDDTENGGRLTRYFMKKQSRHAHMDSNGRINYFESRKLNTTDGANEIFKDTKFEESGMAMPQTLEQVIDLLQAQYGRHYPINTGEEYELMDVEGNFHVENFVWWIRKHYNYLAGENPMSDINPLSEINIRLTYSNIGLADILYSDQFRQQTLFEITGDETKDPEAVSGVWGRKVEHEDLPRDRAEVTLYELGYNSAAHNAAAKWRFGSGDKEKWKTAMSEYHMNSWISRNTWGVLALMPARFDGDYKDRGKEYKGEVDGRAGQMWRETIVQYRNLLEWTDYYAYQSGDSRGKEGEKKRFEHNPFYSQLESNGANAFLLSVAEGSLQELPEAKKAYKLFMYDRTMDAYNKYATHEGITDAQKARLERIYENHMKNADMSEIRLDQSDALFKFHKDVQQIVFGKNVNYERSNDIKKQIQREMLRNLYSEDPSSNAFFNRVLRIDRFDIDTETKRAKGYKGGDDGSLTLGNAKYKDGRELKEIVKDFATMLTHENYERFIDYESDTLTSVDKKGPDTNSDGFNRFINANETMALALAKIVAKKDRDKLNPFHKGEHLSFKKTIIDTAIERSLGEKVLKLDKDEADYAGRAARDALWPLGIAGYLDKDGVSWDFWTRIVRMDKHLERQMHRGYPIIEHLIHEVKFMGLPFLEMMEVRMPDEERAERSLYGLFEGREQGTNKIKRRKDRKLNPDTSVYMTDPGAQMTFLQNHVENAANLFGIFKEGDINWDVMSKLRPDGLPELDKHKLAKAVSDTWKAVRYATDQGGIDYSRVMVRDGREDDIMHLMLGDKTRTLIQIHRERKHREYLEDPKNRKDMTLQDSYLKNIGMGVLASMIGEIVHEHTDPDADEHPWEVGTIRRIEYAFAKHITDDNNIPMISNEEFDAALALYGKEKVWGIIPNTLGNTYAYMFWQEFWGSIKEIAFTLPAEVSKEYVQNIPSR